MSTEELRSNKAIPDSLHNLICLCKVMGLSPGFLALHSPVCAHIFVSYAMLKDLNEFFLAIFRISD